METVGRKGYMCLVFRRFLDMASRFLVQHSTTEGLFRRSGSVVRQRNLRVSSVPREIWPSLAVIYIWNRLGPLCKQMVRKTFGKHSSNVPTCHSYAGMEVSSFWWGCGRWVCHSLISYSCPLSDLFHCVCCIKSTRPPARSIFQEPLE